MTYKGAVLDLDNVLFPTSDYEVRVLRSATNSMIEAGLPTKLSEGLERLMKIRKESGANAGNHFDLLCESYCLKPAPQRIVQAGVSGYHSEREKLFVPQTETNDFLDFLVENNFRSCVVTQGLESKQWFKLVRLGIVNYFLLRNEHGQVAKELVYILENENNKLERKSALVVRFIEEAEIDQSSSFVVDDRLYGIVAAKKVGIRYGFRLKRGKYIDEIYGNGIDARLKHDAEVTNLYELMNVLKRTNLIK